MPTGETMSKKPTLAELAKAAGGTVRGPATLRISGANTVRDAGENEITWASHDRFRTELQTSRAGAVVISPKFGATPMPAVLCEDPELGFLRMLELLAPAVPAPPTGCDPSARIAPSAEVGEGAAVGPHVVLGEEVRIGRNCILHANVVIGAETTLGQDCVLWPGVVVRERCRIGDRVIIHPNATIGADGFGYHFSEGRHQKIPQIGTVLIEDDVEIGANACVDRSKFGATTIKQGTKIDNLVQVAHNVDIGPHCILAGQVGLAGSARLGSYVVLGGKVGIRDNVELGDRVQVAASSLVSKSFPAGAVCGGIPAMDNREYLREQVQVRRLPEMQETIKKLIKRIERLETAANDQQAD